VRDFHCAGFIGYGHLQGVVTDHANRSELRCGAERAVAAGREQQIGLHPITTLDERFLPGFGQRPELLAALEYACGFQFKATGFNQIFIEMQYVFRLHDLIAV